MSSLEFLAATSIIEGFEQGQIRAKDLVQGSELFLHMLDSSADPISTACAAIAVDHLIWAGTIPQIPAKSSCCRPYNRPPAS
jgi:hypothetical protein